MSGPQQQLAPTNVKPANKSAGLTRGASALLALALITGCAQINGATTQAVTTKSVVADAKTATTTAARNPLYELRTYTTNDGKLDALHARFRDHTARLFERHGIQNVAYWTPTDKPNTLVYIVAHPDRDAAKAAWAAFVADPEWKTAYAASIADGQLVTNIDSVFMTATDYSPAF